MLISGCCCQKPEPLCNGFTCSQDKVPVSIQLTRGWEKKTKETFQYTTCGVFTPNGFDECTAEDDIIGHGGYSTTEETQRLNVGMRAVINANLVDAPEPGVFIGLLAENPEDYVDIEVFGSFTRTRNFVGFDHRITPCCEETENESEFTTGEVSFSQPVLSITEVLVDDLSDDPKPFRVLDQCIPPGCYLQVQFSTGISFNVEYNKSTSARKVDESANSGCAFSGPCDVPDEDEGASEKTVALSGVFYIRYFGSEDNDALENCEDLHKKSFQIVGGFMSGVTPDGTENQCCANCRIDEIYQTNDRCDPNEVSGACCDFLVSAEDFININSINQNGMWSESHAWQDSNSCPCFTLDNIACPVGPDPNPPYLPCPGDKESIETTECESQQYVFASVNFSENLYE